MSMSVDDRIRELTHLLRPASGGIHTVSTGRAEQQAMQRRIYNADDAADIDRRWRETLARVASARVVILAAPSDCGAGFTRGSNRGPEAIRKTMLERPMHPYHAGEVVDIGDVRVIPHLLSDGMLAPAQIEACRAALYGDAPEAASLPVSPLDICQRALEHVVALNPDALPIVIGGDHSLGWPSFCVAHARAERLGVLQIDAHTDLLADRLGVRYCFATWAWHANEALERDGRLVQVGLRASARSREHWESELGVRQYWMEEVKARDLESVADEILERFAERGVTALHISHDIDGTDTAYAAATGTPEPGGLEPPFVRGLVRRLSAALPVIAAELVEVAPPLTGNNPDEPHRTLSTAADYLADLIDAGLSREAG